jgi:CDP-L-myo-inositol myo-inositolphosphotransferase
MKCLIIAAGKGSRLQAKGECKPLIPILGLPLIERVIRCAREAGVDEFFVVTGYKGQQVCAFLDSLSKRLGIPITALANEDWEKENGLSVLRARECLNEPFLLLMSDHLFDPSIAREIMKLPLDNSEVVLAVDSDIKNTLVDLQDVTRVKIEGVKLRGIGKELTDFNGFDTGIFLCTSAIFEALERCAREHDDTTLSGAIRILASEGQVKTCNIGNSFWIDVDDPAAFRRAEKALLAGMRNKVNDGPVSRLLNRPLSGMITRKIINYRITPNQISFFSFLVSVLAAGLFALGGYLCLVMGGLLAQFASVVDGCDGEVARLTFQGSDYGGWLDAVLDRYADAFLLFGLTWHAWAPGADSQVLFIGFLAIIGSFMLSYTADKHDSLMRGRISRGSRLRMGRDIRVFVIFLGALFNQVYLTLMVIAIVMNAETLRRLIICRDDG